MKSTLVVAALAIALSHAVIVLGQSDLRKYELAVQFTSLTKPDFFGGSRTEPGFGGRFTFNINENVAVEAEGNFFPHNCRICINENRGTIAEGLFGVKVGKRFKNFGIFGKARPGVASFSGGGLDTAIIFGPTPGFPIIFGGQTRRTNFAFDAGGVVEIYHSSRVFTRFDAGDTMIHYGQRTIGILGFDSTGGFTVIPFTQPADTRHNFQFSTGVGFRF